MRSAITCCARRPRVVLGCVRDIDTVARLGGDELAILVDGLVSQDEAVSVAERVREALVRPLTVGNHSVFVTASIGIALAANDDQPARARPARRRDGDVPRQGTRPGSVRGL